jgi:hypothetical protein
MNFSDLLLFVISITSFFLLFKEIENLPQKTAQEMLHQLFLKQFSMVYLKFSEKDKMYSDNIARFKDSSNRDCMDCHYLDSKTNVHKSNQKEIKEKVLELKEELNKLLDEYSYINLDGVSFEGVTVQYLSNSINNFIKKTDDNYWQGYW